MNAIIDTLKINGLLFYQAFTREKAAPIPPHNPDYLLEKMNDRLLFASVDPDFLRSTTASLTKRAVYRTKNWIAS